MKFVALLSNKIRRIWLYHFSFSDAIALLFGSTTVKVPAFFVARQACDLALCQKAATARHRDQMLGIWVDSFAMHGKRSSKDQPLFYITNIFRMSMWCFNEVRLHFDKGTAWPQMGGKASLFQWKVSFGVTKSQRVACHGAMLEALSLSVGVLKVLIRSDVWMFCWCGHWLNRCLFNII